MTPLERIALRQSIAAKRPISFREFVLSQDFCGIEPSPVVLAIIDASEGTPVTSIDDTTSERVFRCPRSGLPIGRVPQVVVVQAGRRGGKTTQLLAPKALHASWSVPLKNLAPGQIPVALLIGKLRSHAVALFEAVVGLVERSPILKNAVVKSNSQVIRLKRPDGNIVEITMAAADGKGASGRSRTVVFAALDEAAILYSADGYTINDQDIYDSLIPTLVECGPLAQLWISSSPWIEGKGLMESIIARDWGRHEGALVAARVASDILHPGFDVAAARAIMDPDAFQREIMCIPLPAGAYGFFDGAAIAQAFKILTPDAMAEDTGAGCDFGHAAWRDNSALAIVSRYPGGIFAPRVLREIISTPTQKPSETYESFARTLLDEGVNEFAADTFCKPNVVEAVSRFGLGFVNAPEKNKTYLAAKQLLEEQRMALGSLPDVDKERLRDQLRSIVAKPLDGGRIKILAPRDREHGKPEAKGRGHADLVSAFVLALWRVGSCDPSVWARPRPAVTARFTDFASAHSQARTPNLNAYRDYRFSSPRRPW